MLKYQTMLLVRKKLKMQKETQTIIIRFTTCHHRILVYRARGKLKQYKIRMDLTKHRLDLLIKSQEKVSRSENIVYVYSDINCRLI